MRYTSLFCTLLALLTAANPALVNAKPFTKAHSKPSRSVAHKLVALTPAQLARLVLPSVVRITVLDATGQPSVQGSGFVVGPNLIATNVHVIRGAHAVTANFQNGRSEVVHGFVAADSARDLVLLYANTNGVRVLPLMTDNTVQVGDPVVAVGSPEGYTGSLSTGIISQIRRDGDTKILQTTAPISHGSSGGALVDMYGRVLGVTSFFNTDGQNLNFAYASYYLQQLLPHGVPVYISWAELENYEAKHPTQTASAPVTPVNSDVADTAKYTDKPLTGLKGVAIIMYDLDADAIKDGLSAERIKTDTELRLRKAGITVFEKPNSPGNDTLASINIAISTSKRDGDVYVYSTDVSMSETVQLEREVPVKADGTLWTTGSFGTVGALKMPDALFASVGNEVDKFTNDYLAQNPK